MWNIAKQVRDAATLLQVPVVELPEQEAAVVLGRVHGRYIEPDRRGALWERFPQVVSVQSADAWKWTGDYQRDDAGVLFFNFEDEPAMFEFEHCRDIPSLIAECSGFEFYVTDRMASFVLCFNHHDFLIAAGDARPWLASLVTRVTMPDAKTE